MEMFHVKPRWLFLKITCDDGTIGWGEPVVEGRAQTVEAAVKEIARYLIGQDPRDIEKHWQTIYRGSFYRLNVPVWRLLGGKVRDRIRMYGWLPFEPTGDYNDLNAKSINENPEGFTAYKTCPFAAMQMVEQPHVLHAIRDNIILLRDKIDKRIDVALDFHGRSTPAMSRRIIHMIENVDIMFIGHDYLKVPFQVKEGYVDVPHLPGLGIEVDEEKVRAGIFAGDWGIPQLRLKDGSFVEW
ncbi:unnamed protein product [Rotaria sordida]|uniref:Mandelate racemase/muconate lactonizing enzyme N-terminal domain-containing protein n=1 Tax=Rotaria sordida TaxID=392033 RepID=A0A815AC93_9BILA|nr:unnamed protein product [Rotaria sordida]